MISFTSRQLRVIYHHRKRFKLPENNYSPYFPASLKTLLDHETQRLPAASSNSFLRLAGRPKAFKPTRPLSSTSSEYGHQHLPNVFHIHLLLSKYLIDVLSPLASSPLYYITSLTALFENVAMIVDQHQPVVEKYYGKGKMTSVINCLLDECDRVVNNQLDGWEEERSMKRKVSFTQHSPNLLTD
jgi:hypothetical protein